MLKGARWKNQKGEEAFKEDVYASADNGGGGGA